MTGPATGTADPSDEDLARERRRVRTAQFARHYSAQHSFPGVAGVAVGAAALIAASLVPRVSEAILLSPRVAIPMLSAIVVVQLAATVACVWYGGPLGMPHRSLEFVETWITSLTGALFVYDAGTALCIWWFIPVVQILLNFPFQGFGQVTGGIAIISLQGLAAVGFVLADDLPSALMSVVFIGVLATMIVSTTRVARSVVDAEARQSLAQRRLAELSVEAERRRIARDLHDHLGAELSALVWRARRVEPQARDIEELEQRARGVLEALRDVVSGLEAVDVEVVKLADELGRRLTHLSPGVDVRVQTAGEGVVRGPHAETVCRIADEATRNAVRHGDARRVDVELRTDEAELVLTIEDDGTGITAANQPGHGLQNMHERAETHGGTFEISTSPSLGGARVVARLPFGGEQRASGV